VSNELRMEGKEILARCVRYAYSKGERDGEMAPIVLWDDSGPLGRVKDGDVVIFACRRGERERQLVEAFTSSDFAVFPTVRFENLTFITLTQYDENFKDVKVVFPPEPVAFPLAEVMDREGIWHLHVAESEKYAHVTYFFNGGKWLPFAHEKDVFVPSPRVEDYTKTPRMSADKVGDVVVENLGKYGFIVVNFANGDVLGHLPDFEAQVLCAKAVDENLRKVTETALAKGYVVFITADHGLLEVGFDQGNPDAYSLGHTLNPVPFIALFPDKESVALRSAGKLADVAPTVLHVMGIAKPSVMTGRSLILEELDRRYEKVLLVILDGWGMGRKDSSNPIYVANPCFWNKLLETKMVAKLCASGECVGLLPGHAGNSEAGHMNIGAGRVVLQDEVRLENAMRDGTFATAPALMEGYKIARTNGGSLHIINMLSMGSSHGTYRYAVEISKVAENMGVKTIFLHEIFNRHGVEKYTADKLIEKLADEVLDLSGVEIVTGMGRKWALDRDKNWDRTRVAYDALVYGKARRCSLTGFSDLLQVPDSGR